MAPTSSMLRSLDVGVVNGHYFFHSASIQPVAGKSRRHARKGFHVEVMCDGHTRHLFTTGIAIGVGHYVSEEPIEDAEAVDRHQLFFCGRVPVRWCDRFCHTMVRDRPFHVAQASRIQIVTDETMPVFVDGKLVTHTPATFTLLWNT